MVWVSCESAVTGEMPEKTAVKGEGEGGQGCYHVKSSMVSKMFPTSEMKKLRSERLRNSQVSKVAEPGFEFRSGWLTDPCSFHFALLVSGKIEENWSRGCSKRTSPGFACGQDSGLARDLNARPPTPPPHSPALFAYDPNMFSPWQTASIF